MIAKIKKVPKKISELSKTSLLNKTHEMEYLQVMNFSKKVLLREGNFLKKITLISMHKKLIYLNTKDENLETSMLIDTGTTNSFMSSICA